MDINEIWGRELQKQFQASIGAGTWVVSDSSQTQRTNRIGLLGRLRTVANSELYSVSSERAHVIAKTLFGLQIIPERVMIFDSVQARNFHGRISTDYTFSMKLETSVERKGVPLLKNLKYFPSGSVVERVGAALLACCQMKNIKASLCLMA
ncbi:hypothetical protein E3N88_39274 [Mikania micrantha]|uniref:Uncharacterized protein n=1 Tax=Mikania micrantha TaxID=192012 RepID=A0A5N6LWI4_9ASTR|nr:hypothetical protein E3N88_39274 [Mikania micrantha]